MDLRLTAGEPSAAERDAVDAVLGPPGSSWVGGDRGEDAQVARGGHAARSQRHLLLPVLHEVQGTIGWISPQALGYVCRRLTIPPAEAYGVASFYALFGLEPRPPVVAHVCTDIACMCRGGAELVEELERTVGPAGAHPSNGNSIWMESPCLGLCERPTAALITRAGVGATRRRHRLGERRRRGGRAGRRRDARVRAVGGAPGQGRAAPAAADRPRRPDQPRQLSLRRRLRGAAPGVRAGAGRRDPRGHRVEAARPRRRGLPDRAQVGRRRPQPGAAALPGLQRRRVRAGHLQGPDRDRERPVRADRGADDRRPGDRLRARLHLPARRVPAGLGPADQRDHGVPGARAAGRGRDGLRAALRHRAAQGRRRVHLRRGDGAVQLDRGRARRAAQQAAVPGRRRPVRQADGGQQRREPDQRAGHRARGRRGVRAGSAPSSPPARGCCAFRAASSAPASTRRRSASRCARCWTPREASPAAAT